MQNLEHIPSENPCWSARFIGSRGPPNLFIYLFFLGWILYVICCLTLKLEPLHQKPDLDCVMLLDLLIYFSSVRTQTGCALEICTKTELLKKKGEL